MLYLYKLKQDHHGNGAVPISAPTAGDLDSEICDYGSIQKLGVNNGI